jgi:hypothetical protein
VQTTSPPDKALPRPLGSSTSKGYTTCQHFVTLHLLEAIKGACMDYSKGGKRRTTTTRTRSETRADNSSGPCTGTSRVTRTHSLLSHLETWEFLPLSHPLITPTTSTSVQDNIELTSSTGRRALLGPNQYKLHVFFWHTIRTFDAQTLITRWC